MRRTLLSASAFLIFLLMILYSIVTVNATELPPIYFEDELCDGGSSCPGRIFQDMPKAGHWAHDAIDWAVTRQITKGSSADTFSPSGTCTRAEIVTFLWRASGSPAPSIGSSPFTDVQPGSYFYDAVLWAVEQGITKGTAPTVFSPKGSCTRAQIVTFLWRYAGSPEGQSASFGDVPAGAYYARAVAWAVEKGVTKGTSATEFSPAAPCTRAQAMTLLYRYLK